MENKRRTQVLNRLLVEVFREGVARRGGDLELLAYAAGLPRNIIEQAMISPVRVPLWRLMRLARHLNVLGEFNCVFWAFERPSDRPPLIDLRNS